MKAHLIDIHLLVAKSRSSATVKVKYQGHISHNMAFSRGISVSLTHLAPTCFLPYHSNTEIVI